MIKYFDMNGEERKKHWDGLYEMRLRVVDDMRVIDMIFPTEADIALDALGSQEFSLWSDIEKAPADPFSDNIRTELDSFLSAFQQFLACTKEQFREGTNLDGARFIDCKKHGR
jgi:hypothetical protein